MLFGFVGADDVNYFHGFYLQKIRDQSTMTAPPERLGAHDCRALVLPQFLQSMDASLKFVGHHVIGVAAEGLVAPGGVRRIVPRPAPATQFREEAAGR